MKGPSDASSARHPIQVVARRTGLSPDVLRAWERRYAAVVPQRSPTGRRLYSDRDIERLNALRRATEAGRSIAQVAGLSADALTELLEEDASAAVMAPRSSGRNESGWPSSQSSWLDRLLNAVERLDGAALREGLAAATLELAQPALIAKVIVPLMVTVGDRWRAGTLRVAHEHLATAAVVAFLGEMSRRDTFPGSPTILIATPAGQKHQIGAMLAASTALAEGWNVLYLGSDLPVEEIAAAAQQREVRAVGISLAYPTDDPLLPGEVSKLRRLLPANVSIIAGGRAVAGYRDQLLDVGVMIFDDLPTFGMALADLSGAMTT
jgi:DNA-binding transcriptional MerR regulator/methylmalonyl-CoA mutase cobalamin-binding subunit